MHVYSDCSDILDCSGQQHEGRSHQISTMFTPITLLRFSFLPCAATLHVKAHLLAFVFLDQDI